jgi:hypothetical protein
MPPGRVCGARPSPTATAASVAFRAPGTQLQRRVQYIRTGFRAATGPQSPTHAGSARGAEAQVGEMYRRWVIRKPHATGLRNTVTLATDDELVEMVTFPNLFPFAPRDVYNQPAESETWPLSMNGTESWDRTYTAKSLWLSTHRFFGVQKIAPSGISSLIRPLSCISNCTVHRACAI